MKFGWVVVRLIFFLVYFNGDGGSVPIPFKFNLDGIVDYAISIIFCEIRIFVDVTGVIILSFIGGG